MGEDAALPAPSHLFTWVDVDQHFTALASHGLWPDWLLEVDGYWDDVVFTVEPAVSSEEFWSWLTERLGPLTVDPHRELILLESTADSERSLTVRRREDRTEVVRQPRWNERRVVRELATSLRPPADPFPHSVRLCAFHSFKGGVGRTLHCVALARELAARPGGGAPQSKVLLVDADMEAPGISWMLAADGSRLDVALDDFVALLHGSTDGGAEAIALTRKFLVNQEREGVMVLPTTRDPTQVRPPRITPVDLLTHDRSPYLLTDKLAELARAVGADTVVMDLRAGASELNAPVLLDPRVHRVFVTTLSEQSVRGTEHLLDAVARLAPSGPDDPACTVLVTQFDERDNDTELAAAAQRLTTAVARTLGVSGGADEADATTQDVLTEPLHSPFLSPLLALPGSWRDVGERIERTGLRSVVADLAESIRPVAEEPVPLVLDREDDLATRRRALVTSAQRLVFADSSTQVDDFLPTDALVNLVSAHRTEAPIEVVVGAKGSGKTFTYLRMCDSRNWEDFGAAVGVPGVELAAPLVPVLASRNLTGEPAERVAEVSQRSAFRLSGSAPASSFTIRDLVDDALGRDLNDTSWRRTWLSCLAQAAGLDATAETAEHQLTNLARDRQSVFVIDGLEDLFQDFSNASSQQRALRVLLTDCPEWLRSLRGRPLGLVVFVRRDLVLNAIRQNAPQFLDRYAPSALHWNSTEALRLAAWVCERAGVLHPDVPARSADYHALSGFLVDVWGQKLGRDGSREARSEEWVLAALSDFNLQIQARDIVSFLSVAARESVPDTHWTDRLLTPPAMRRALPECSKNKVDALGEENPPVRALFDQLTRLPREVRRIPFTLETVNLLPNDARLLEANGVLFRENDQYWIPEIYRYGLGFASSTVGRPRVVSIRNRIRARGGTG